MKTIKFTKLVILALLSFSFFSCSTEDDSGDVIMPANTIADFIAKNNDYSSLRAALKITKLDINIGGSANYTLFAPNNAAFNTFLSNVGYSSLNVVPKDVLTEILLNHFQKGEIMSDSLSTGYIESMATGMVSDAPLSLYIQTGDTITFNGVSSITTPDIKVDNGVIHAVDAVIDLPDVSTFATADPNFDFLVQALTLEDSYSFFETLMATEDPEPITVFAPTNDAFAALLDELEEESLNDIPSKTLEAILAYHVVLGANIRSEDLFDEMLVKTLQGDEFSVNIGGDSLVITDAKDRVSRLIAVDAQAINGVIHQLDTVLLPAE